MKLIVLYGPENSGKTTTLEIVYERLKRINVADSNYFEYVDSILRDFLGILEIDTKKIKHLEQKGENEMRDSTVKKVGVVTQGDYVKGSNSIYKHLEKMYNLKCEIVICACSEKQHTSRQPIDVINKFVKDKTPYVDDPIIKSQRIIDYSVNDILQTFVNLF